MNKDQIVFEIVSESFTTRKIPSKEAGKPGFAFNEQRAYMHKPGDPYPSPCHISLGDRKPFPVGRYTLAPDSFTVGRYGSPELVRELQLIPAPVAAAAAPAAASRTA